MKWLAGAMQGLFVAVVGAILLAIFQDPIAQRFRSERVDAWLEMGPWMVHPTGPVLPPAAAVEAAGFGSVYAENIVKEDEDPIFGKLTLANKTSEVVHHVRMRFNWPTGPDAYYQAADGKWIMQQDARDLQLPDLAPGERKVVYLWEPDGFSDYMFDTSETYSSAGRFRLTRRRPEAVGDPFRETDFDRFMADWFWWVFAGISLLFAIGALIMFAMWSEYAKALLKSDDFYLAEQERFIQLNPKQKFEPDYNGATKVSTIK